MKPSSAVAERMARALNHRIHRQGTPTVAPRWLIEHPIWHDPERAARYQGFTTRIHEPARRYKPQPVTLVIETHNDLPLTPCRTNRHSAGGLLRWRDMDLAIAVSRSWTEHRSPYLECHQRELLAWMGYDLHPPYREIRGSLDRLRRTAIALYVDGTRQQDIPWFTIFKDCDATTPEHQRGSPTVIRTELSGAWLEALGSLEDWTIVELDCYAHLARKARRLGLARALYLYFAARRSYNDLSFNVTVSEVRNAFADRKGIGEGMRFADPFHPRSRLHQAMKLLHDEGVIAWHKTSDPQVIAGVFQRPQSVFSLGKLSQELRQKNGLQMALPFHPGIFGSEAVPGPTTVAPATSEQLHDSMPTAMAGIRDSLAVRALPRLFRSLPPSEIETAINAGWTTNQFGHLIGYVLWVSDTLANPTGFLISELRKGSTSAPQREDRWSQVGIEAELQNTTYREWGTWARQRMQAALVESTPASPEPIPTP